jgi:hypothetical protein
MASLHGPSSESVEQLAEELKHPNADAIWNRALEIFGDRMHRARRPADDYRGAMIAGG